MSEGDRFAALLPAWVPEAERDIEDDGDFAFDWFGEGEAFRSLAVSVTPRGMIHYAALLADEDFRIHGRGAVKDGVPVDVLLVLRRLYPERAV